MSDDRTAGAGADYVKVQGHLLPRRDAQEAAMARIEHEAYMTDAEFEAAYAELDAALGSGVGLGPRTLVIRLLKSCIAIFNTGRLAQAERLSTLVLDLLDRFALGHDARIEVLASVTPDDVNEGLVSRFLSDPDTRADATSVLRVIGYFHPAEALVTLAAERRRDRRRLLLNAIEVFGPAAWPVVFERLAHPESPAPWYVTRNLLFLISRLDLPPEAREREAVERVGRFAVHDQPQVRTAAVSALRHIGGREAIPFLARALEPSAYPPGSIDDADLLRRHLLTAMEGLVESGNETAMSIVAEMATGARGAEFDLGAALKEEALVALAHRAGPLPRRAALAVVAALDHILGKRLKLIAGKLALGVDPAACRNLSALIADSEEPEAREILSRPVLAKLLSKHASAD